jgi:post-segregation antitoxin (ccd killing protein)
MEVDKGRFTLGKVTIYLSDELEARVRDAGISMSPVCQQALTEEVEQMEARNELGDKMEAQRITLWRNNDESTAYDAEFVGTWLVYPDPDESRTTLSNYDNGAYWGIALTERQAVLVYSAHCNDNWAPNYQLYDSVTDAGRDVPEDILADAASQLGESYVVKLDV